MRNLARAAITLCVTVAVFAGGSASAAPVILSPRGTVTPGGTFQLDSGRWYPDTGGCSSKVKVTIRDAAGKTWSIGRYEPRFSLFENHFPYEIYDRSVRVPEGMKAGSARVKAEQTWGFRFPIIKICIDLFKVSATRNITVQGAVGNDPPVISDLSGNSPRVQRTSQPITWTASEPCTMTLRLLQDVGGVEVDLGPIVENYPSVAGANTYAWDTTLGGAVLTTGDYRILSRCVDASNAASAPTFTTFHMRFQR